MAEAKSPAPAKRRGGFLRLLPILIVVIAMPAAAWFGLDYMNKPAEKKDQAKKEKKEEKPAKDAPPPRMAVPLTKGMLAVIPPPKIDGMVPRVSTTNAILVNSTKTEQIVIQFADSRKPHHAVMQILLVSDNTAALIERMNKIRPKLYDGVTNYLSAKYFRDTHAPSFRNILRTELVGLCNRLLETNLVQEVILPEFVTQ